MPLLRQKFQPLFPDPDSPNNYNCGEEQYCHLLQLGDEVKSQFYQTPCAGNEIVDPLFEDTTFGAELLTDGDFPAASPAWVSNPLFAWTNPAGVAIYHAAFAINTFTQTGLAITTGEIYRFEISISGLQAGDVMNVYLGQVTPSLTIDTNGADQVFFIECGADNTNILFEGLSNNDFVIWDASLKLVSYNSWDGNSSWNLSDGFACHIEGTTGLLEESVADYITADEYYEIGVTVTGYVSGTCDVYVANVLAGTLNANGTVYFYATPTLTGVVSFDPSSDFIGCLDFEPVSDSDLQPGLYELRNDHLAYWVDPDGTQYQIGQHFQYYERWVTLIFDPSENEEEIPYGCSYIQVVDACVVTGNNLVINPGFADNGADWNPPDQFRNYSTPSGEAQLSLDPITGTDYISNGDFSGGFTDWTAGAGWSISGGGALHTPGSTATLLQAVNVPLIPTPPGVGWYYLQFTVSGRTAGSVSVTLEDSTKAGYSANDTQVIFLTPTNGGAVDFYFTPTSDFDGTIDDISIYYANVGLSSQPAINNVVNTNIIAGNYEMSFEITAQSDPLIAVGIRVLGMSQSIQYFDTVGVHTVTLSNYVPGAQIVQLLGRFGTSYGIAGTINIDNVEVYPAEPFEATYTSECIIYGESFANSKMMVAYCDQEAFGFEFINTNFRLQQRAVIRSIAPNYPREGAIQRSGNGNARITYAGIEKFWQLHTAYASETFHDALAAMVSCDHFLIGTAADNGTEYIAEIEDYNPEWIAGGVYSLAPAIIQLRIKENGQLFNRHI